MGRFDTFGWGELISFIAVVISFATITTSLFSKSKKNAEIDTKNEQKIFDIELKLIKRRYSDVLSVLKRRKIIVRHVESLSKALGLMEDDIYD